MKNKVKEALDNLKQTRYTASMPIDGDPRTRPGREGLRRQAMANLPQATLDFTKEFGKVGFTVFVDGPEALAPQLVEVAKPITETIAVSFYAATQDLRSQVKRSISHRTREFSVDAFNIMVREFRQLGVRLSLDSIPTPIYNSNVLVPTDAEVDAEIDTYMLKYLGPEFIAGLISQEIVRDGESLTFEASVVPVFVYGVSPSMREAVGAKLFNGKYIEKTIDVAPKQEDVTKMFKTIKTMLKTKE